MSKGVYNLAILDVPSNSVCHVANLSIWLRTFLRISALIFGLTAISAAADWNTPEQNLARKILAITGPARVVVAFENRSSLGKRNSDVIENGLRSAMQSMGLRLVAKDPSSTDIVISLSENPTFYVWVAQIRPANADPAVTMVSTLRPVGSDVLDAVPMNIRKIPLYAQAQPILDVVVLEESTSPTRIAVLDPEEVSTFRIQSGRWQPEQALTIRHDQAWPRDLRGRLILTPDHSLQAYLPGVICATNSGAFTNLDCRQSDDPWPLVSGELGGTTSNTQGGARQTKAFFAPTRNFFTGVLTPAIGKFPVVPSFFSAARLARGNGVQWLFAATDGHVHMVDEASDQIANVAWGSDLASVKTACGVGSQILATGSGDATGDSIRAYEFPDRDPVAVSPELDFDGAITALWTEPRGDTAVVVVRNRDPRTYEAFRLAMACGQ
jgi:hypothetical protein